MLDTSAASAGIRPFDRRRLLAALGSQRFDVLVIGGGITECGVVLDAASRGLRAALVERDDFASAPSSRVVEAHARRPPLPAERQRPPRAGRPAGATAAVPQRTGHARSSCRCSSADDRGPGGRCHSLCSDGRIPVTAAGGRRGVCGVSVPIHGGVVLDLTATSAIVAVDDRRQGRAASVKRALEPNGILNPGKLGPPDAFGNLTWSHTSGRHAT